MHMRTKALVLRETAYKESDKILTLLTQEAGKLTASGRGCRKKGSPIAAGCQLLVWSDMVLYEHRGRWAVQEAAVEREFRGMRDDLVKFALGCYGAEVTELLAVEGVPNPELLALLLNSLLALDQLDRPPALVKAAFELRCLCLAGYGPLLDACAVCGRGCSTAPPAGGRWGTVSPCRWTAACWPPCGTSSTGTPSGCSPSSWGRRASSSWEELQRPICSPSWSGGSAPWTSINRWPCEAPDFVLRPQILIFLRFPPPQGAETHNRTETFVKRRGKQRRWQVKLPAALRLSKKSKDFSDSLQKFRYFPAAARRKSPRCAR